jgi:hypothetical protein
VNVRVDEIDGYEEVTIVPTVKQHASGGVG